MGRILRVIFSVAGIGIGLFFIWSEVTYLINILRGGIVMTGTSQESAKLTFTSLLQSAEHAIMFLPLIVLPGMLYIGKVVGKGLYSAIAVLAFSGLCVLLGNTIHSSLIDGYMLSLLPVKPWLEIAWTAVVLITVAGNWLMTFGEMYRVVKEGIK